MLTLTLKDQPTVPLEAEMLTPDRFAGLGLDAIRALPVFLGKRQLRVDDFFSVEGEPSDQIELHGDLAKVKWIGRAMTRGQLGRRRCRGRGSDRRSSRRRSNRKRCR